MRQIIQSKLQELLKSKQDIPEDLDLKTIGLDSLIGMRLIVDIEIMFDITINDEDLLIENFSNVLMIEQMVKKYSEVLE